MSQEHQCPQCGKALVENAPQGLCPACLLKRALLTETNAGLDRGAGASAAADTTPFAPPTPAELAPHFPELEILELLGYGGMGVVYKARQKRLDRIVALKILSPRIGRDPAFAERFAREAKALARLNHQHIVTVHDFGQSGELFYFVMEYVEGVNLRQLLNAGRIAPKEALAIVPQICEALQFAHDSGVVHRDIKPENILLDKKGTVKIADFGLAKLMGAAEPASHGFHSPISTLEQTLTQPGAVMGTPQYMAPEQTEHPDAVDHRADIYSLGVVFYQMLTGELPIGRFAVPSKKFVIDVRLDEVVLRALEKEPALRYQHASEVKSQVETIAGTLAGAGPELPLPAAATSDSKPIGASKMMNTMESKRAVGTYRRGLWAALVAAALGLLLGGLASWWANRPETERERVAETTAMQPAAMGGAQTVVAGQPGSQPVVAVPAMGQAKPHPVRVGVTVSQYGATGPSWRGPPYGFGHTEQMITQLEDSDFDLVPVIEPGSAEKPETAAVLKKYFDPGTAILATDVAALAKLDVLVIVNYSNVRQEVLDAFVEATSQRGVSILLVSRLGTVTPGYHEDVAHLHGLEKAVYGWNEVEVSCKVVQAHPLIPKLATGDTLQLVPNGGYGVLPEGATALIEVIDMQDVVNPSGRLKEEVKFCPLYVSQFGKAKVVGVQWSQHLNTPRALMPPKGNIYVRCVNYLAGRPLD